MITAHFVGGPADGRSQTFTNPSWHLIVPVLAPIVWSVDGPEIPMPQETRHMYRRVEELNPELEEYTYTYEGLA